MANADSLITERIKFGNPNKAFYSILTKNGKLVYYKKNDVDFVDKERLIMSFVNNAIENYIYEITFSADLFKQFIITSLKELDLLEKCDDSYVNILCEKVFKDLSNNGVGFKIPYIYENKEVEDEVYFIGFDEVMNNYYLSSQMIDIFLAKERYEREDIPIQTLIIGSYLKNNSFEKANRKLKNLLIDLKGFLNRLNEITRLSKKNVSRAINIYYKELKPEWNSWISNADDAKHEISKYIDFITHSKNDIDYEKYRDELNETKKLLNSTYDTISDFVEKDANTFNLLERLRRSSLFNIKKNYSTAYNYINNFIKQKNNICTEIGISILSLSEFRLAKFKTVESVPELIFIQDRKDVSDQSINNFEVAQIDEVDKTYLFFQHRIFLFFKLFNLLNEKSNFNIKDYLNMLDSDANKYPDAPNFNDSKELYAFVHYILISGSISKNSDHTWINPSVDIDVFLKRYSELCNVIVKLEEEFLDFYINECEGFWIKNIDEWELTTSKISCELLRNNYVVPNFEIRRGLYVTEQ